jgi:hypothetical protein
MDTKHLPEQLTKIVTYYYDNYSRTKRIKEEYYKNKKGEPSGEYKSYYENGCLKENFFYKDGFVEGCYTRYFDNKEIQEIMNYKSGRVIKVISLKDDQKRECTLPDGEITIWKACKAKNPYGNSTIPVFVKLQIPKEARRITTINTNNRFQARVEYAKVLEITDNYDEKYDDAYSFVYGGQQLKYTVGEIVFPSSFNTDPNEDCGAGINVHRYIDLCKIWFYA